ncbi:hypothetical protein Nepgr_012165 [Nepenthes gracilis]|uniref:Uncharacterized protein n=1 Tax=Nepenthes gracilis TaxID=150966 RepID=A0AAD3SGN0_NEPGR|nr:hypothetical protein Nepgr_012165 [Nepenthes gracilis]
MGIFICGHSNIGADVERQTSKWPESSELSCLMRSSCCQDGVIGIVTASSTGDACTGATMCARQTSKQIF